MSNETCITTGCTSAATSYFLRIHERRPAEQRFHCEQHGRALLQEYHPSGGTVHVHVVSHGNACGILFDVEAIYSEKPQSNGWSLCEIILLQLGGSFRLPIQTGLCELAALNHALDQISRPLTHDTMTAIIGTLGGCLDCVTLDEFLPDEGVYEANLHIRQGTATRVVATRASDAITVAVLSNAPILVSPDVLTSFGKQ